MNPGSKEAIAAGCKCPLMDNHYGQGYHGIAGVFVYTEGCPIHWPVGQDKPTGLEHADSI